MLLAYVYVGYPSLLAVIRLIAGRQVSRADIEPSVCVFITANDEAEIIAAKLHNTPGARLPGRSPDGDRRIRWIGGRHQ